MELMENPEVDPCWVHAFDPALSGRIIARTPGIRWIAMPMAFTNWRLVGAVDVHMDSAPVYGWCFKGELALMASAAVWDPEVQDEPLGWHKRAGEPRQAPRRSEDLVYNRLRCVHGSYLNDQRCTQVDFCPEFPSRRMAS